MSDDEAKTFAILKAGSELVIANLESKLTAAEARVVELKKQLAYVDSERLMSVNACMAQLGRVAELEATILQLRSLKHEFCGAWNDCEDRHANLLAKLKGLEAELNRRNESFVGTEDMRFICGAVAHKLTAIIQEDGQ